MASRLLQLTLLALAAVALVAGCGGDGGGDDLTEGLSAEEVLERSVDAFAEQEAYRLSFEADIDATLDPPALPPSSPLGLLASLGRVSGEGPVQPPDASLDVAADFGPFSAQANVTWVDGRLFAGLLGRDFEIQTGGGVGDLDVGAAPRALLDWVQSPTETGRSEIDGTPTVQLSADIDRDQVIDDLSPLLADGGVSDETGDQLREAFTGGKIDVWIGESDLLPRRLQVSLTLDGEVEELSLAMLSLNATLSFSDFGTSADITAPEGAQPLALDELGQILGG